ncbi:MAG: hypothetical protein Q8K96_02475 [Rubrivivax sp.]|nr:hypothetical protein [Rubrivivax sp.]
MNNAITRAVLALSAFAWTAAQAMTGDNIDAKFRGDWVPAKAACASPLKLVIEANAVTFINGGQRAEFRKLEQCFSCAGGARDIDPPTMLSTDAMGDSPWMIYLDRKKKTPTLTVDFSNDKKLGARFPLGTAALRKCP